MHFPTVYKLLDRSKKTAEPITTTATFHMQPALSYSPFSLFYFYLTDKIYLAHGQKRSIEAQQPVKEQQNKPQVKPKQQPKNPASAMIPAKLPENTIQIDQGSYITVFDTINNIPFYSAYVITPEEAAQIGANKGMAIWKEDIERK